MNPKAKRLATFIQELRGSQSQRQLAKQLGVSQGSVNLWESGQSLPDTENLDKLAALRGWSLSDLQAYLVKGDLPDREPLEHILNTVRALPLEAVAQVAAVAVETLANRSISNQGIVNLTRKQDDCSGSNQLATPGSCTPVIDSLAKSLVEA